MRLLPLVILLASCANPKAGESADTGDTGDTAAGAELVREPQVCGSPTVDLSAAGEGYLATTEHYVLHVDGFDEDEARNLATLAETAWGGFAYFFDAEVSGPLEVWVAADETQFYAQLAEAGVAQPEGAGGYYDPGTGDAFLYRQPTAYYSRVLLLHELTHQYQDHVSGTSGLPSWYVEGLAESLGRHHWDGTCVELRVRPLLSWEDAAASAQVEIDAGVDLDAVLAGGGASRPLAQELLRLLTSRPEYATRFADWRGAVAAGTTSPTDVDALEAAVAPLAELEESLVAFVPEDQEPMSPVWYDWVPTADDAAWGFAEFSSAARVKGTVLTFSMATAAPTGAASVGTVYGYDAATGDAELALVSADGSVSRFAVLDGRVTWDVLGTVALGDDVQWSQVAGEGSTTVTLGGEQVELPRTLEAAGGLALYDADAVFDAVLWE